MALLSSCHNNSRNKQLIIGDWNFSKEKTIQGKKISIVLQPYISIENNVGFDFINDTICFYKSGYFKQDTANGQRQLIFLGVRTKYTIEDSTLKVWNLQKRTWDFFKIHAITKDSLVFEDNNTLDYFVKAHHRPLPGPIFDELIVSSSGCFGSCPINRVSIKKNGDVIYYGKNHNTINGLFTSHISKNKFHEIEERFYNADYLKLDNYMANWTDDNTINLTFVKDGKIIKQIEDYGLQSPAALRFAYQSVGYMYQHLKLQPMTHDTINEIFYNYLTFENKEHKVYKFERSECFYLATLIQGASTTTKKFKPKYEASFNDFDTTAKNLILTDGRLFKFINQKGKSIIYDLGYNYFDRNDINGKFVDKLYY